MISSLPDLLLSKIIYYLLYNANKFNKYLKYFQNISLVCKEWHKICQDIQNNNITGIKGIGKDIYVIKLNTLQQILKQKNKSHLKLVVTGYVHHIYNNNKELDNHVVSIDLLDRFDYEKDNISIRPSPSLQSISIPINNGNTKIITEFLVDNILVNLKNLTLAFRKSQEYDISELDPKRFYSLNELSLRKLGQDILVLNGLEKFTYPQTLNLKKLRLMGVYISSVSLNSVLRSLKSKLKTLVLNSIFPDYDENGINEILIDGIANSETLIKCHIKNSVNPSLKNLIQCLNTNKSITSFYIDYYSTRENEEEEEEKDLRIINTTLKYIEICEISFNSGNGFDLYQYWENGIVSGLINLKLYQNRKFYVEKLNTHLNCKALTFDMELQIINGFNDLFKINLPNLQFLCLEIYKLDRTQSYLPLLVHHISRYINAHKSITQLHLKSLLIDFSVTCELITELTELESLALEDVTGIWDDMKLYLAFSTRKSSSSLKSIEIISTSVDWVKCYEYPQHYKHLSNLIRIIDKHENLQTFKIMVASALKKTTVPEEILNILHKMIQRNISRISFVSLPSDHLNQILQDYFINNQNIPVY